MGNWIEGRGEKDVGEVEWKVNEVRSELMNSLNVYQYIVYCLKTIRSYKGDLADLLANKWKPADTELMPVLA